MIIRDQTSMLPPAVAFDPIDVREMNTCLVAWGHKMGPLNRPAGVQHAYGLIVGGSIVGVVGTSDLAAERVSGFNRQQAIELSRVCAERPDICRILVRLWREFVFPHFSQPWAVSYQDAALHSGDLYRFDGWIRLSRSHSGADTRSGREGRDKWIWGWRADPIIRDAEKQKRKQPFSALRIPSSAGASNAAGLRAWETGPLIE